MTKKTKSYLILAGLMSVGLSTVPANGHVKCSQVFNRSKSLFEEEGRVENIDDVKVPSHQELVTVAKAVILSLQNYYGPLRLKETTLGLDFARRANRFLSEISKVRSEGEMLFKVSDFLHSLNDAHVSIKIPSTLKWTLPLQVSFVMGPKGQPGKYILNYIERDEALKQLRGGELPQLGAELVAINGVPVNDYQKSHLNFNSSGNDITNSSMFGSQLFSLSESSGIPLSMMANRTSDFEFSWTDSSGTKFRKTATLEYQSSGIGLISGSTVLAASSRSFEDRAKDLLLKKPLIPNKSASPANLLYDKVDDIFSARVDFAQVTSPVVAGIGSNKSEGYKIAIGQRLPVFKLPPDFSEIKLPENLRENFSEEQIFAGTFRQNGKRVGLLRIPTYSITDVSSAPPVIEYLVRQLEMKCDYLILDQMNNPGGSVTYSDMWIRSLVGKVDLSKHLRFQVRPTDKFLRQFAELLAQIDQQSIALPNDIRSALLGEIRQQFEMVQAAYRTGELLSQPITLIPILRAIELTSFLEQAVDRQVGLFDDQPNYSLKKAAVFTKPIVMLINQFDFSGGDATPASLSDYKRVHLVGVRTAGAGGTVEPFQLRLMSTEFTYRLTTSLMYRPANEVRYVENYGVQPDVKVEPSAEDYTHQFQDYFKRVLVVAEQLTAQQN